MFASRVAVVSFVSALALAPALASDNSKSHIDPDIKVYGHADQMSTGDQSSATSDDQQVAVAPSPNDPNYVQELQDQLKAQQQALNQAQSALKQLQAQLAQAQALLQNIGNYQGTANTTLASAQKAYNTVRTNFINGTATMSALSQATLAFEDAASSLNYRLKDNNNGAGGIPLYVIDDNVNSFGQNMQEMAQAQIDNINSAIQAEQVEVTRLQALVTATTAQITAAQNGQPPPGQTGQTDTNTSDTATISDPSNVASASIDAAGQADTGDGGD